MSDETSVRLGLPLLQTGQAQKEMTHNEALTLLDFAVQPVVEAVGVDTPPAAPAPGACWVVGPTPQRGLGRAGQCDRRVERGRLALYRCARRHGRVEPRG